MTHRNPVLKLAQFRALHAGLDEQQRRTLALLLREIGAEAERTAEKSWGQRKAPMAAYWRAVGVYARHIARALSAPQGGVAGAEPLRSEPAGQKFLVWSRPWSLWWGANRSGYTNEVKEAGRYTEAEADAICRHPNWRGPRLRGRGKSEVKVLAPESGGNSKMLLERTA